jgi:RNA polymerase sigma-70 factor, ECF subfamily
MTTLSALTFSPPFLPQVSRPRPAAPEQPIGRDADAFAALYEAHVERIHAHVRARVGDADLADDLTAQVFLRAWQAIERYRPVDGRPFLAWLFTIANNLVVDHYRRGRRELVGIKGDPRDNGAADPERCALTEDLRHELRRALSRLKPEHQLIVSLRLVDGLDYGEISAITGKTPGALRVTLCRALTAMRHELTRRGVHPS